MNLESITDTLSWYKISQLNGFNRILPKQKFLRKQKSAYKSSWSRPRNPKSFTLTNPWNWAKPVKTYLGVVVRQHLTVQRQMVLLKERYAELKKGLLQYWSSLDFRKAGGQKPWSVLVICETFKIYCLMVKTLRTAIWRTT